jgi:hypothetical protein
MAEKRRSETKILRGRGLEEITTVLQRIRNITPQR